MSKKNVAAAVVFVCIMIAAACADSANAGDIKSYIVAGVCVLAAVVAAELSWHGYLD